MVDGTPYIIQYYFDYLQENPWEIAVNTAFMFLVPFQDVFLPHYYGLIISSLESGGDVQWPFFVVLISMIILHIGFYMEDWHDSLVYPKIQEYIREKILKRVLEKYETSYKELNAGEMISVIVKAPVTMTIWFERMKNTVLPFFLAFFAAVVYIMFVDVFLGMSLLAIGSAFIISFVVAPAGCSGVTLERDRVFNLIHEEIDDLLRNMLSVYGADQAQVELERSKEIEKIHRELFKRTVNCIFKYKVWITPISITFLVVFIYRCMTLASNGIMTSSKFVPVFIIVLYMLNTMVLINDQFRDTVFEWGIIQSANEVVRPNTTPVNGGVQFNVPERGIGLSNVTFRHSLAKNDIFSELSIHIREGERVVITGDIGSGKSTLLKLLLRYYEPTSGCVYWKGSPYYDVDIKTLRKEIGYVPQTPVLFNRSLIENITYGIDISRERVIDFLVAHGIMEEFNNLERGIDTRIGKNGSHLSGGQRQLVWCIRVLLSDPEVIVLDEPTSSVDERIKELLLHLLETTMSGKTVVMVTHDMYLLKTATRVIHMRNGKIVKDINARVHAFKA